MKKTLLIILSVVVFVLVSCEKNTEKGVVVDTHPLYYSAIEFDGDVKSGGTGMSVATISFTELDRVVIDITTDPEVTALDVYSSGTNIGASVTLTGGAGTLNASMADMEVPDVGDNNYIGFHYEIAGNKANETAYLKNVSPWDMELPSGVVQNDTEHDISWEIVTANATVDDVTIELKVGANGTPTVYAAQMLADDMMIMGSDYVYMDTVFVSGTATAGTLTSDVSGSFVIGKWSFGTTATPTLTPDDTDPYDLDTLKFVNGGHMGFTHVPATSIGITGTDIEFVVSDMATYDENNIVTIMTDFDAGAKVTGVTDLAIDDVLIFLTVEGTYGIMKVTDRNESFTGDDDLLKFEIMIL